MPLDRQKYFLLACGGLAGLLAFTGENIALESPRTIEINEFVPKSDIDPRYLIRPYYLVPDGKVGHDAFAVIGYDFIFVRGKYIILRPQTHEIVYIIEG